jgi:molybdenum cofactor cytidylyltransferase
VTRDNAFPITMNLSPLKARGKLSFEGRFTIHRKRACSVRNPQESTIDNRGIAALIPAAGFSSRMGALKPLLPIGKLTAIEAAVIGFHKAGISDVRVVIGSRAEQIVPILDRLAVRKIFNPEYAKGMFSSVRVAISSLEPEIEAFFLLPSDVPLLKPATIQALVRAYRNGNAMVVYPRFEGERGHPPLISMACVTDLPEECEGGLRTLLSRYEPQALDIDLIDESILMNCNTPEDYRSLQIYAARAGAPTERECRALWARYCVSEKVIAHSREVARIAAMLAVRLNLAGFNMDTDLVVSAAYLHDLARQSPDHARAGAALLDDLGFGRTGRIVASHTDIQPGDRLDEADLVYLADKCVAGDSPVTLDERFERSLTKYRGKPEILEAVARRSENARAIRDRVEKALRIDLDDIIRTCEAGLRKDLAVLERNIYLVRHGAVEKLGDEKRYIGLLDVALSPEGVRQAELLSEKLKNVPLTAIYCSDLQRSVKTAGIIAWSHGLEPCARQDFREISLGCWEGLLHVDVMRRYPAEYEERGRDIVHFRPPGGESFLDCANRTIPALNEVLRSTCGDILIVGHAGVNRILLCQAMGKSMDSLFDIAQDYGCLNRIRYVNSTFELETLNEAGLGNLDRQHDQPLRP